MRRVTGILIMLTVVALVLSSIIGCSAPPEEPDVGPAQRGPQGCLDFEGLLLNTTYHFGDVFTDSGVNISIQPFQLGNNQWTSDGFAKVTNKGYAGSSGQDIMVNNISLVFDFIDPLAGVILDFGEYGGNCNININGDFANFANFADINGAIIGGVHINVINGLGNDTGKLELSGIINQLVIGGQELYIDHVHPNQ